MADTNTDTLTQATPDAAPPRRRKSWWKRLLKWFVVTIVILLLIVAGTLSVVVWTLTPDRLTPLVNKYSSEYLLADVDAKRIELTFWSTFPHFSVTVDSLRLTSRTLRELPDSVRNSLPADADSLLYMRRFAGGIDLRSLVVGDIKLYNVDFHDIRANLVQVDSTTANYLIMPPSEPDTAKRAVELPSITIDRFLIADGMVARYRSPADSLDCRMRLDALELSDLKEQKAVYRLTVDGDASAAMPFIDIPSTPFGINGKIGWDSRNPMQIALDDFTLTVDEVAARFSTALDFTDGMLIKRFKASIPEVEVTKILNLVPERHRTLLKGLDTDLSIAVEGRLMKPFDLSGKELPVIEASLKSQASRLLFDRLNLSRFVADVNVSIDCNNPDASTIDLTQFTVTGRAIDFTANALVTTPVSDPLVNGSFNGSLTFQNLPSMLLDKLPCAIRGTLRGKAELNTRMSYLTPTRFHLAKIDGELSLNDLRLAMTDGSAEAFIRLAEMRLGTSSSITYGEHLVDSMLTASLTIDTMSLASPGVSLSGSSIKAGVGARNIATSSDTTRINPIGANIEAGRLIMRSDSDSVRVRLRKSCIAASLQRYEGGARSPLLKTHLNSGFVFYADRYNRMGIREVQADFSMHPKARPQMSAARQARFDSIAALHPELSADSIKGLMRAEMRRRISDYDKQRQGREDLTMELDNSIRALLRRWNANGSVKARRGRLFTPYFPSRNTISDLNLTFSTDSVLLRDTRLRMNHSDFLLNGAIRNLSRALMSRHGAPFELDFSVSSDTIDINDLTATMLRGAVFADKISEGTMHMIESDSDGDYSDDALHSQLDAESPDSMRAAVLIPSNINGRFTLKARHVLYADLWLHGLDGLVEIYDGAVNLDRLRAYTSIGAVNFTALYSAPTINDLSVAAAVRIRRLNLRSVLDMMPEIDSLLPLLGEVRGIVDADLALTSRLDSMMNLDIPSLNLALKISGDSLQLLDNETFRTIAKWMMFKKKQRNMIDHMDVELAIHDGYIDLYPFIFDMDRYRLGVRGSNDAAFNLDYHVAVIKSPIPFKFGINIKGTPEKMKIRLGKARVNEKTVAESRQITDTMRVNLINQISNVFRRGVRAAGSRGLKLQDSRKPGSGAVTQAKADDEDAFTHADSVTLIQQGLIPRPPGFMMPGDTLPEPVDKNLKKTKKKKKENK